MLDYYLVKQLAYTYLRVGRFAFCARSEMGEAKLRARSVGGRIDDFATAAF
jgi:hypothetical protein